MERSFFTFIFCLIFSLFANAGQVEYVYTFSNPIIRNIDEFQSFSFGETLNSAKPGEPALPYQAVKLLLPPGESATDINFEFSGLIELNGAFRIYPQQYPQSFANKNKAKFAQNKEIYSRNSILPLKANGKLATSFLNGKGIATSCFTPMRYNPATGKVSYYTNVKVTVLTQADATVQKSLKKISFNNRQAAENFVDNPFATSLYKSQIAPQTINYEILIITSSEYTSAFSPLITSYLRQGMRSSMATVENIGSTMTGIDLQEKIRNYIIQEYTANGFAYLILGGDVEIVPARGLYGHVVTGPNPDTNPDDLMVDEEIPSDIYYAALDGTWDFDEDGIWGEPADYPADPAHPEEADLSPVLAVGRLPFGNLAELNTMIHKSISYQTSPVDGEFRNHLLVGEILNEDAAQPELNSYGSDYLDLLIGDQNINGYETSGIPENFSFDKMYSEILEWDGIDILDHIDMGRPMIHHLGHTNPVILMSLGSWEMYNENFPNTNGTIHNYPILYSQGCDAGAFDIYELYIPELDIWIPIDDCIAEYMLIMDNFASAFVGNSRFGWFYAGMSEGPSEHLHREFVDGLFNDPENRIGRAHQISKILTAPCVEYPGQEEAMRWVMYDNNVLGDPAMAVFTDNAKDIQCEFPANLQAGAATIDVHVSSNGNPLPNTICTVLENGLYLGKSVTSASGDCTITLSSPLSNISGTEIIVSGKNIVPVSYNAQPKTYTWNQTSGTWKTAANWTPARTSPAANDILVFDGSIQSQPAVSLDFTSDENIGKLQLSNNCSVTFSLTNDQRGINVGTSGITSPEIEIANGSSLTVQGSNALAINLNEGSIAAISGNIVFDAGAHRLTAFDPNSITFNTGAYFTAGNTFSGHAFGTETANSVLFAEGSHYIHQGGYAPFGLTAPASVVAFQPQSFYQFKASVGAPEVAGRSYGNLEIDSGSSQLSNLTGEGNFICRDLTIKSGNTGLNLNSQIDIKGNISIVTGATLTFNPTSPSILFLNGTNTQLISGAGNLIFGNQSTINSANPAGVVFNKTNSINNLIISSGTFTVNE